MTSTVKHNCTIFLNLIGYILTIPGPILALIAQCMLVPGVIGRQASLAHAVEGNLPLNGFPLSFIIINVESRMK